MVRRLDHRGDALRLQHVVDANWRPGRSASPGSAAAWHRPSSTRASLLMPTSRPGRQIGDMRPANDRHHVVLAMAFQPDVAQHHMVPIIGRAPYRLSAAGRVVGISKLARGLCQAGEFQEKLTAQVANCINDVLQRRASRWAAPLHDHPPPSMVTSRMLGAFRDDASTRREFLAMIVAARRTSRGRPRPGLRGRHGIAGGALRPALSSSRRHRGLGRSSPCASPTASARNRDRPAGEARVVWAWARPGSGTAAAAPRPPVPASRPESKAVAGWRAVPVP